MTAGHEMRKATKLKIISRWIGLTAAMLAWAD